MSYYQSFSKKLKKKGRSHLERCNWNKLEDSEIYLEYHDKEWGAPSFDDKYLFEMFVLETFHCGLSWLTILRKRDGFRCAFDDFDALKIAKYDEQKVASLLEDTNIVRNKAKILATIQNAKAYLNIVAECGSFSDYLWSFTNQEVLYFPYDGVTTRNDLSDVISRDLKKRGFQFMGSVTCYSYLEAIGIMNNHAENCFQFRKESDRGNPQGGIRK